MTTRPKLTADVGGARELVPEGVHLARCYRVIHIGTRPNPFGGNDRDEVYLAWEIPAEMRTFREENGEEPMSVSAFYTRSMNEKANLRKLIVGWKGSALTDEQAEKFDIFSVLGRTCMLNVIHEEKKNGNQFEKVQSISPLPKGTKAPAAINAGQWYSPLAHSDEDYNALPEFLQKLIAESAEYKELQKGKPDPKMTELADKGAEELEKAGQAADQQEEATDDLPWD